MEIATLRHLLLTSLLAAACPACLILDPVDFPERQNHHPSARLFSEPLNSFVGVNRLSRGSQRFEITVFDEDRDDELEARAFVNGRNVQKKPTVERDTSNSLDRIVRLTFDNLEQDFPKRGCHVVEMYVVDSSQAWDPVTEHGVVDGFIQVQGVWNVLAHDGDGVDDIVVSLGGCVSD